ncbi:neo-calmodulin-like [Glandiceps talaboti]
MEDSRREANIGQVSEKAAFFFKESEILGFEEEFALCDRTGEGVVRVTDIMELLRLCGHNPTKIDVNVIYSKYKTEGRSFMTFREFVDLMMDRIRRVNADDEVETAFATFDTQKKGYVDAIEIRHSLETLKLIKIPQEEINEMMEDLDSNGDGKIQYSEFKSMMGFAEEYLGKSV